MYSYFTIVSANIRPEIDEKVSLGLLLVGGEEVYFNYSKNKLNTLKELLPVEMHKYVKEVLKQIAEEVADRGFVRSNANLFDNAKSAVNTMFSKGYIEYLTKYSNNILSFSTPKVIELSAAPEVFQTLYAKYIDSSVKEISVHPASKFDFIRPDFYPRVQNQYNIEQELSSKEVANLPVRLKVDMIGINERVVFAQSVDLERPQYHILHDVGIISTLNQVYEGNAVSYIISSEPNKQNYPKQHEEWQDIRKGRIAEYIDLSEIEKLKEYADIHGVQPLIS